MSSSPTTPAERRNSKTSKLGYGIAKVLQIDLQASRSPDPKDGNRSLDIGDTYVEEDPTVEEWMREHNPTAKGAWNFLLGLFPFINWMGRYNRIWFVGDVIAGVTVGTVVVPQSMAYAGLALLPPEFGLYSSFVGVLFYWFFATSKDITIGPVAVMSTLVGNIVVKAQAENPNIKAEDIGGSLALVSGCIVFGIGLLRLGFIVDYIPLPAIAAFMTGSALNIAVGQVPGMMGIKGFSTRESTYKVLINTLKHLGRTKFDAAMGLSALVLLYFVRWACTSWGLRRYPKWSKSLFFASTLRTAFVMLFYTMISWLVNMNRRDDPAFKILGKIPRGFKHMGVPKVSPEIIGTFMSELPATVIVLLIEHIAISKSFGRLNNYTINPSQELIAIGFTNIFGPFFGAYPATGSFSRTAIKSKAGVRTPFAGVITAGIVLLAIYALTAVFFYIPQAALSAVIIHAVGDLITPPSTVYKFWMINPIEVIIFLAGVIVTVFKDIETGIYVTVAATGAMLLFRISKAKGQFLGTVKIHSIVGRPSQSELPSPQLRPLTMPVPNIPYPPSISGNTESFPTEAATPDTVNKAALTLVEQETVLGQVSLKESSGTAPVLKPSTPPSCNDNLPRNVFLPIDYRDGTNPTISIVSPYPGIFIYRFSEGLVYSNAAHYTDHLVSRLQEWTQPGEIMQQLNRAQGAGNRPWNDPGPMKGKQRASPDSVEGRGEHDDSRPTLKAIIFDFSGVNNVDITSVQNLIDVRNQLDRYASPEKVEWHFAAVRSRWTKRALASAGFGVAREDDNGERRWQPVFSVAEIGDAAVGNGKKRGLSGGEMDEERGKLESDGKGGFGVVEVEARRSGSSEEGAGLVRRVKVVPVSSVQRPFFHPDIEGALRSAIYNMEH
ncbi:sulfate transporter family-domain-containing protein [Terfezia claveryi]|nr:sulfate transporter family-domain-containing protein [Terfezia claveryi]